MLILASGSPRRQALLQKAGFVFRVEIPRVSELPASAICWLTASEIAIWNALHKGRSIHFKRPRHSVLSADTVVALGACLYGKPKDQREAARFLSELSDRTHEVITAVCLFLPNRHPLVFVERSSVTFKRLNRREIQRYLSAVDVLDKAGGYALQKRGRWIIRKITGSRTNVIGLPMELTQKIFIKFNG